MKRSIKEWWGSQQEKPGISRVIYALRWLGRLVTRNMWLKVLSLVLAVLLWNYVITSDTSITRPKTLFGLTGYLTGQSTLSAYGLAILEDPSEALSSVSVTIEAPQANYSRVSNDNVQVMLDVSNVRTAGVQEVPLRATSSYGRVRDISPESVKLTFEALDSRSIPVNYQFVGEKSSDYWYSVSRVNPTVLTVSGAASVVRSIASAYVYEDVTGLEATTVTALPYTLLDGAGAEVSQTMLNRSTSSISLSVDVTPAKNLPISTDIASVITGQPAAGYMVQSVSVQPETITVAADGELLDGLTELKIEPVTVDGLSQSFSARAKVSALSDFKYVSNEQVYVNVTIAEETASGWVEDVSMMFVGQDQDLSVFYEPVRVFVIGPRSAVEQLMHSGVSAQADLTGLGEGTHSIALTFDNERYPGLAFQSEPMTVTLRSEAQEEE